MVSDFHWYEEIMLLPLMVVSDFHQFFSEMMVLDFRFCMVVISDFHLVVVSDFHWYEEPLLFPLVV
jgi:hypothetical protein